MSWPWSPRTTVLQSPNIPVPQPSSTVPQWAQFMHAETLKQIKQSNADTLTRLTAISTQLSRIEKNTMALQDDLDAVALEITTATAAVVAEIDALEAQIAAGVTPDLTGLRAAAAALDAVAVPPAV
jgi:hypothetical protein